MSIAAAVNLFSHRLTIIAKSKSLVSLDEKASLAAVTAVAAVAKPYFVDNLINNFSGRQRRTTGGTAQISIVAAVAIH